MQANNITISETGFFVTSSFNGIVRDDWWGDMEEIKNLTVDNYDTVDFMLEMKMNYLHSEFLDELQEEFNYRISNRNYPPGFLGLSYY
jgi:uncharacterized protein YbcC (UPF0753/DUF2309 family)